MTSERIFNEVPPRDEAAYEKVKAVLRLCNSIIVKWRQTEEQFTPKRAAALRPDKRGLAIIKSMRS